MFFLKLDVLLLLKEHLLKEHYLLRRCRQSDCKYFGSYAIIIVTM